MTAEKKLRVAFIGAGGIARAQMRVLKGFPDVEIVAAADVSEPALAQAQADHGIPALYRDWKEMLRREKPAAVSVCTPNGLHAEHTIGALRAGAHVMVEKPMAMNAREASLMTATARRLRRHLVIGFQYRFDARAQFIRQMATEGRFGRILFARCQALRRRGIPNWGVFGRKELQGGGPLIDIGVHIMEVAHYCMGSPRPVAASGQTFRYLGDKPCAVACRWPDWDHKTYTVEDLAIGHIRFDNGAVMHVEASFAAHGPDAFTFTLMGEKGGADFDPPLIRTDELGYMVDKTPAYLPQTDGFGRKLRLFVNTVLHGAPTEAPAEAGLMIQKMMDAIYASAAKGGREVLIR